MTWSRYRELNDYWHYNPPPDLLLSYIATAYGYKPPSPPKAGDEAMTELLAMFPGGVIRGAQS